jgi:hypothetical protein
MTLQPPSLWQEKAYLVEAKEKSEEEANVNETAHLPTGTMTASTSEPTTVPTQPINVMSGSPKPVTGWDSHFSGLESRRGGAYP